MKKRINLLIILSGLVFLGCKFNNLPDNTQITDITNSPIITNVEQEIIPKDLNLPQKSICFNNNDIYKLNEKLELEGKINFNQSKDNNLVQYWSPDKQKLIVFKPKDSVKLININNNEIKNVTINNLKQFKEVKWSPLSDYVAFLDEDIPDKLILKTLNLKGEVIKISEIPEILIDEKISETFSWSHDGKKIAYGFNDIYTSNPDGSEKVKLTDSNNEFQNNKHVYYFPQLSTDGKFISFFDKYLEAVPEINLMTVNSKEIKKIGYGQTLKWFPDINNFLFISQASKNDGYNNFWLKVNAENPTKKVSLIDKYSSIEFVPNQEKILFKDYRVIGTISFDGEDKMGFVDLSRYDGFEYNISDDGRKILYSTRNYYNFKSYGYPNEATTGLYIVNPDGTGKTTVFEKKLPSENPINYNLSKDGNLVFYIFNGSFIFNISEKSTYSIDKFLPNECENLLWY